ncbi:MAG: hypothetical protein R3F14_46510, partial [Polyangiaceae bacterium]
MAFRTISLADVKEVLGRWQRGQAQRRIARDTGMDRKTVQRYIEAAGAAGLGPAQGLSDDAVRAVAREV